MKADTIQFKVGEQIVWMNITEWEAEKNWYNMRDWIMGHCILSGCDINDPELIKQAHKKFNIPQPKATEPERKGKYIMTNLGMLWQKKNKYSKLVCTMFH